MMIDGDSGQNRAAAEVSFDLQGGGVEQAGLALGRHQLFNRCSIAILRPRAVGFTASPRSLSQRFGPHLAELDFCRRVAPRQFETTVLTPLRLRRRADDDQVVFGSGRCNVQKSASLSILARHVDATGMPPHGGEWRIEAGPRRWVAGEEFGTDDEPLIVFDSHRYLFVGKQVGDDYHLGLQSLRSVNRHHSDRLARRDCLGFQSPPLLFAQVSDAVGDDDWVAADLCCQLAHHIDELLDILS